VTRADVEGVDERVGEKDEQDGDEEAGLARAAAASASRTTAPAATTPESLRSAPRPIAPPSRSARGGDGLPKKTHVANAAAMNPSAPARSAVTRYPCASMSGENVKRKSATSAEPGP
jgi:hypothetical protein